jgi:hypothetical protein
MAVGSERHTAPGYRLSTLNSRLSTGSYRCREEMCRWVENEEDNDNLSILVPIAIRVFAP